MTAVHHNNDTATVTSEADFANDVEVASPTGPKMLDLSSSASPKKRRSVGWVVALTLMLTMTLAVLVFGAVRVATRNDRKDENVASTTTTTTTTSSPDDLEDSTSASVVVPPADPNTVYWKVTTKAGDYYKDQCVVAADNARCIVSHDATEAVLDSYGSLTCEIQCAFEVVATNTELHVEYFDTRASVDKMTLHGLAYSGRPLQFFDYPMEQGDVVEWRAETRQDMSDTEEKGWRICLI